MTPTDELAEARATIARLNRRCQEAEAALADLKKCHAKLASGEAWVGGSLGRAFLAWDNQRLRDEVEALKERILSLDPVSLNP